MKWPFKFLMLCITLGFTLTHFTAIAQPQANTTQEIISTQKNVKTLNGIYNARYCEVIIIKRQGYKMHAAVYNSLHLGNCPAHLWRQLNADTIKKQFNASIVKLNGPRFFVMNALVASKTTIAAPITTIGGIRFQKRAEITANIWDDAIGSKLYAPNKVQRYTIWIYNPGTTIYKLIAPNGDTYVMQSYAQIVDPNLHINDLAHLGSHLKLPTGWKYQVETLTKPLKLKATGIAYVINDDLYNSYQKQ